MHGKMGAGFGSGWWRDAVRKKHKFVGGFLHSLSRIRGPVTYFLFSPCRSQTDRQADRQTGLFQTWAFLLSKPRRVSKHLDSMFCRPLSPRPTHESPISSWVDDQRIPGVV